MSLQRPGIYISTWRVCLGIAMLAFLAVGQINAAEIPAFPSAEGFGSTTPGGRGGKVLFVTNLNDKGPGSLREAIATEGPRIVVFRVAGTIVLNKTLRIKQPFITIAGQTAPGGGIALRNALTNKEAALIIETHDVVIRYLRVRPGPCEGKSAVIDAVGIEHGACDVVLDHCSLSWSVDETLQFWGDPHDVTAQWCFITEALHKSVHPLGAHGKSLLLGSKGGKNYSIHHNLLAHNDERNPRVGMSGLADFVNNVIYNHDVAGHVTDDYTLQTLNYVGNFVKRGPHSSTRPPVPMSSRYELFCWPKGGYGFSLYVKGNIGPHRPSEDLPEDAVVRPRDRKYVTPDRHDAPQVTTHTAAEAYELVLKQAGATLPKRDAVDERIVREVRTGTGQIVNHPDDVGGWPTLEAGTPPIDADNDGMPDAWETKHQFDPSDPSDNNADQDGDGYTNIEEFLNDTDPRNGKE